MKTSLYWNGQRKTENSIKGGANMVEANVVRDFHIGNTRIKIADNYCKKTACEVQEILKRVAEQAQRQFVAAAATGNYGQ